MSDKPCPDQQVLQQLLLGHLAAVEAEDLEEHLVGCDLCAQRAGELTGQDDLIVAMQAKQLPPEDDGRATELIERLREVAADAETSRLGDTLSVTGNRSVTAFPELAELFDAPQLPDEIGRIGEYRVLDVLGVGGMGIVLQAEDPHLKRQVAIKVIKGDVAEEESAKSRFIREARTTAAIEHDNIVTIYQVAEHRGMPYYAMQFLRGESLDDRLKRDGALGQSEVLRIGREIAEGLTAAHAQHLLHRDIKPDNIWLEVKSDRAKIVDFGLARDAQDDQNITMTGAVLGTPRYMAPEQALGKPVDGRCDLFSLGCVMYHLATGRPPFAGENLAATLMAVINEQPQPITQSQPNLDPELGQIIDRLLAKDPAARFQTAVEVVKAVRRIEQRLADQKRREEERRLSQPTPAELYRRSQRRRVMIGTALVAGLLAIAFGIVFVIRTQSGTVRVEVNDDNLEVLIDGREITLTDNKWEGKHKARKHRLAIKLGEQELKIGSSAVFAFDDSQSGHQLVVKLNDFTLSSNEFEVVRGDVTVLTISLERRPATLSKPVDANPPPLAMVPCDEATARQRQQAWADYLELPVEKDVDLPGGAKISFRLIPPGEFTMGSPEEAQAKFLETAGGAIDEEAPKMVPTEGPQHRVRITRPFYLGKCEVTQAQWQAVMGSNPSQFKDNPARPVECVSWDDTQPFLAKLNEHDATGQMKFALPTEAQWEYACRAGTTTAYCFGNGETDLAQYAWFNANASDTPHPVGRLKANAFGLYDVYGNVWEWCSDWYAGDYYNETVVDDPSGPSDGSNRVARGGSFGRPAWSCRSAYRGYNRASYHDHYVGFRLAMTIDTPKLTTASSTLAESSPQPAPPLAIAPFEEPAAKQHQQVWANYLGLPVEKEVDLPGGVKMSFMLIPPGEFMMGSTKDEQTRFQAAAKSAGEKWAIPRIASEGPVHRVRISQPFYLAKFETTQLQWAAVMGTDPETYRDKPPMPQHQADWNAIQPLLANLNASHQTPGEVFALPSEAQWEYACRAGTTTLWHCGEGDLQEYAWFSANTRGKPHPVGQLKPNAFGIYDMHGNVWEWCADWYAANYYGTSPSIDPDGSATGSDHVRRGGSRAQDAGHCRSAHRRDISNNNGDAIGFRLAMTIDLAKLTPASPTVAESSPPPARRVHDGVE